MDGSCMDGDNEIKCYAVGHQRSSSPALGSYKSEPGMKMERALADC